MTDGLAASTPQNGFLDSLNGFTEQLTSLGQGAANIYSTFLGAKSTYDLAQSQKKATLLTPNVSPTNAISALMTNKGVTIGVFIAVAATGFLIYKAVK